MGEADFLNVRCRSMIEKRSVREVDINALRDTYDWLGRYIDGLTEGLTDENTVIEIDEPTE